jgi:hypothetical protein
MARKMAVTSQWALHPQDFGIFVLLMYCIFQNIIILPKGNT